MRQVIVAVILIAVGLAGCFGGGDSLDAAGAGATTGGAAEVLADGGIRLTIPVDIVLVGFDEGTGAALDEQMTPWEIRPAHISWDRRLPPDPNNPQPPFLLVAGGQARVILQPHTLVAQPRVHEMPPSFAEAFWSFAEDHPADDEAPGLLDANVSEPYLADALATAGVPMDSNRTTLVILHAGNRDTAPDHTWRITYSHGHLDNVRHFGERTPLVVHDMSAPVDPYVADESNPTTDYTLRTYDKPVGPGGSEAVAALVDYVRDATFHRALQPPVYPVSTKPCHDVRLVFAVDTTSLAGTVPDSRAAEDWVDIDAVTRELHNLTGGADLDVRLSRLALPADDPQLAAHARGAGGIAGLEPLRSHMDTNWRDYAGTLRPGCEAYVSIVYFGDAANMPISHGIALYEVDEDRRLSFSIAPDVDRIGRGMLARASGSLDGTEPRERNLVNLLFSHETGHLFGQNHPGDATRDDGTVSYMPTVDAAHTTMSVQQLDRTIEHGAVEQTNWLRNRALFAVWQAQKLDMEESAAFAAALEALENQAWQAAFEPLAMPLADAQESPSSASGWSVTAWERLPVEVGP